MSRLDTPKSRSELHADAAARAQEARDLEKALISTEVGRMWPDASYAKRAYALLPLIADTVDALVADLDRVTRERDAWGEVATQMGTRAVVSEAELAHWKDCNLYPYTYRDAVEKLYAAEAELAAAREREQQLHAALRRWAEARHDVSVAAKTGTLAAEDQIALNDAARDLAALAEARSALGDGEQHS